MFVFILQILVSVLFFVNKVLWLIGKKTGWLLGAIAAAIAVFYFYLVGLYVFTVFEIGLIGLMLYGLFAGNKKNQTVENLINISTVLIMSALAYFAFSGLLTIYELISSTGLLFGTYLLSHEKFRFGWIVHFFAHMVASYMAYLKGQDIYALFQFASVFVAAAGISLNKK